MRILTSVLLIFLLHVPASAQERLSPVPHKMVSVYSRAFDLMNEKRARSGKGPLTYNETMTKGAEIKVARAARLGITGHQGGSFYGGNKEGAGWSSAREEPMACYLFSAPTGTPAGFAMAKGRRGWHSLLLIKHNGYLPSGATRAPGRRLLRIFRR